MSASIAGVAHLRFILVLLSCLLTVSCGLLPSQQQKLDSELLAAIRAADAAALRTVLKQGANPNAVTDLNGTALGTLLHQHKRSHQDRRARIEHCTQLLLEHHADPEMLHHGFTPLQIAAGQGSEVLVAQLIKFGANPSAETRAGLAPIWQAVYTNNYRVSLELLRAGANPNALNTDGLTPLEYLQKRGFTKTRIMVQLRHYGGH